MTPELVRMSALEVRPSLNSRPHTTHEVVQEYIRRLENGETPPPIEVDRKTGVVFDGVRRLYAYKHYYGDNWKDAEIPVIWRDDLPNPDEEPDLWRLMHGIANREHGERVSTTDKRALLRAIYETYGVEVAKRYAKALNETEASLMELVAIWRKPEEYEQVKREFGVTEPDSKRVQVVDKPASALPVATKYRPSDKPTSHLRGVRPPIKTYCRNLIYAIDSAKGDLTPSELNELANLYERLRPIVYQLQQAGD